MPCWARQLKHIFFRCPLFFFQSELPLDPRIPGVWVGGCLGIWHQSWSMGSSATRPWGLAYRHQDVWLAGDGAVGCGMSNLLSAPSPPNIRLKETLGLLSFMLQVCWLDSALSVRDFRTFLWFYISGVEGQWHKPQKGKQRLKPTENIQ